MYIIYSCICFTEKCVSWPVVTLLVLYIYVEAYIRLNNPDHIPYKLILCKPLAANW